jgi:hypothetical protein
LVWSITISLAEVSLVFINGDIKKRKNANNLAIYKY